RGFTMNKYLKMSDYFDSGEVLVDVSSLHDASGTVAKVFGPSAYAHHVAHAINSHDELVAEVERLRGSLTQCVNALYIAHKFCGNHTADECGDEIAIPISDALVAASKIVSE
ncbi:MAG: hypothetical protein ACRDC4_12900, partial [Plesiomonas sp.]